MTDRLTQAPANIFDPHSSDSSRAFDAAELNLRRMKMRAAIFIAMLFCSATAFADQCRCREEPGHSTNKDRPKYVPAACPTVQAEPGYKGGGVRLKFNQVSVEEFYGLLADFSGARVCLGSRVGGNLAVNVESSTPWNVVAEDVAKNHGYRAQVSSRVIYIYTSTP